TWLRVWRRRWRQRSKSRRSTWNPMTSGFRTRTASFSSSSPVWSPWSTAMVAGMQEMICGGPSEARWPRRLVAAARQLASDLAHHVHAGVGHVQNLPAAAAIAEVLDRCREPDAVAVGDGRAVDEDSILGAHDRLAGARDGRDPYLIALAGVVVIVSDRCYAYGDADC